MSLTAPIRPLEPARARLAGIVLAAGASSRMGRFKPLLPLAGVTVLERSIALLRDAGADDVLVVIGNRAEELRPLAERYGARCVHNANWEQGMFSSVVAGVRALPHWAQGAFVLPVDVPLVRSATVRRLAAAFATHPDGIVYPVFDDRRGHPPLIPRSILDEALLEATCGPLSTLLAGHEPHAIEVPVADEAIHLDMDTPAAFEALAALATRRDIPTVGECEAMLALRHVAGTVVRHSRKVGEVAGQLAVALVESDVAIDPNLARAGGLLHDMAKGEPEHAWVGAEILRAEEMPRVADIVASHTEMQFGGNLDERAIVYLADKLVGGDRLVTLDERFQRALDRFRSDPDALAAAHRRKAVAEGIATAIESRLGVPLKAILRTTAQAERESTIPTAVESCEI
jgi:molybdenum cofactor cytidylyltransferase